jgi:N-acetylglucosaminyl-diphospho-decaprenol L-rhamnosyltransferase
MMGKMADLTVIILSWNTCAILEKCLDALDKFGDRIPFETLVVDNGSTDGSQEMVRGKFPKVSLYQSEENLGFARGNNRGIDLTDGAHVLLLNSDAFLTEGALAALLKIIEQFPQAGIVGAQLVNPDGSFQASHSRFPGLWQEFLILSGLGRFFFGRFYPSRGPEIKKGPQKVDYVEGACLLVRREALENAGKLSEEFFMYAEEVDWCYAMKKAGWDVWYQPEARIVHVGGASSQNRRTSREGDLYRSRVIFFKKNYGPIKAFFLKWMILASVGIKNLVHGLVRFLSGGKNGRVVIPFRDVLEKMRGV